MSARRTNHAPATDTVTADAPTDVVVSDAPTATDAPVTTDAPTADTSDTHTNGATVPTAYAYDPATVVRAYQTGAVRLDVAKRAAQTAMGASVKTATSELAAGNADAAMSAMTDSGIHAAAIDALDAAAKTASSGARIVTVADYVTATVGRVAALRNASHALRNGTLIPADVPAESHSDYVTALRAFNTTGVVASDAERDHATSSATRRVIGTADIDRHMAQIATGTATDAHGALFVPVVGTVYPFRTLARLHTSEYPAGNASSGAIGAAFTRRESDRYPAGWTYATMPRDARATHGARFNGVPTATADVPAVTDAPSA